MKTARPLLLLATTTLLLTPVASAATSTGTLTVTATVGSTCTINDKTLTFTVTSTSALNVTTTSGTGTASVTVACNGGLATLYTLGFGNGQNYDAAGGGTRRMKSGSNYLPYTLAYSLPGAATLLSPSGDITVTGTITPTTTDIPAGTYTDSVIMTLSY